MGSIFALRDVKTQTMLPLYVATGWENSGGFRPLLLPGWTIALYFCLVSRADSSVVFFISMVLVERNSQFCLAYYVKPNQSNLLPTSEHLASAKMGHVL